MTLPSFTTSAPTGTSPRSAARTARRSDSRILAASKSASMRLLPLYRRGRLARDVVDHAVDAAHFIHDAVGHFGEELVRQRRPVRGHEVGGLHRAQCDDVLVGTPVAHDAYGFHREKHRKCLRHLVVPTAGAQLLD